MQTKDVHPSNESFLKRWSRVKREVAEGAVPVGTIEPVATALPDTVPEVMGLESDFTAYMQAGVSAAVRRTAMNKLFHLPQFNVQDGLDVYIDDYSVFEPIAASELPGLTHARSMLYPEEHAKEQIAKEHKEQLAQEAAVHEQEREAVLMHQAKMNVVTLETPGLEGSVAATSTHDEVKTLVLADATNTAHSANLVKEGAR